ncbi:MAG: hypothetical protein EAX89_14735 [Candidatus Lokiarchaeota archaeon]|nr:hypothetical protein [Candidatus Lokiarchaeota archaeon]
MITNNEIFNEELYEEIYNYIKSKEISRKKEILSKIFFQNVRNKSLMLNKVKQGFILIAGLACITLHIVLLFLKLM